MLYLLHGEDEFTRSEELARLRQKMGDPTVASLNTTTLDGRDLSLATLMRACDTLPFMAERRLVIVQDFWSRFESLRERKPKDKQPKVSAADTALVKGLLEYLPRMPETTRLAFLEGRTLSPSNRALTTLPSDKKRVFVKAFSAPEGRQLEHWIVQRMTAKGGSIHPLAAQELARLVGSDLRQLEQELEKLWAHVNYGRTVTVTDVQKLVAAAHTINVFALVDAMGMRQTQRAVENLHDLLEAGERPLGLLGMIERQFRILLQVKELRGQGASTSEMQRALGIRQEFIIEKSLRQARHFSMPRLESIYNHLAEVEQHIKTGEMSDVLALDLLVVELCA